MYEKLKEYVNSGNWEMAEKEFERFKNEAFDDEFAVLGAVICRHKKCENDFYQWIVKGLSYNHKNYELYLLLGNYYEEKNCNQAWLCYENAEFFCDNQEDMEIIQSFRSALEKQNCCHVNRTSIVILSYNHAQMTKECLESIRKHNPASSYEIIVIDNHSTDGVVEWLKKQTDMKLICNEENKGFPYACNQGIKISEPDNDIFLLNNDTIMMPNSLFWLRMGLYENERIGATGSVSNHATNGQGVNLQGLSVNGRGYETFASKRNVPMKDAYQEKIFLEGFAVLIKRQALDEVGLLDIRFTPGNYEDNDIGIRLHQAGWNVRLCHNSFIFHYGSGAGDNRPFWNTVLQINAEKFKEKWKFDFKYSAYPRREIIQMITHDKTSPIRVLEIGCALGATLLEIKYQWKNAIVQGIEISPEIVHIGEKYLDMIQGNIETMEMPYEKQSFDYIIFADVLEHLYDPAKVLKKMKAYLKEDGKFLCSISNIMNIDVISELLKGNFFYQKQGILDETHIRFFSWNSIVQMVSNCGLKIEHAESSYLYKKENKKLLEELQKIEGVAEKWKFETYQYLLRLSLETSF